MKTVVMLPPHPFNEGGIRLKGVSVLDLSSKTDLGQMSRKL
jgi:hypothetical protein